MMRCVFSLAPVVLTVALSGCSRENAGERLTRECREVVDAGVDSENTTNPAVATVKRTDMEAVIRSEQWATTPRRKAMQAELAELETSRGYTSDKYDAAWERLVKYRRRTRRDMARRTSATASARRRRASPKLWPCWSVRSIRGMFRGHPSTQLHGHGVSSYCASR